MDSTSGKTDAISESNPNRAIRIYLVDDDPNFLMGVSRVLKKAGFDVTMMSNPTQAIPDIKLKQPDLVILDVDMPGMSGFDVKRELENDPFTRNLPVIFLTGFDDRVHTLMGLNLAEDYINKPFDADVLVARVNTVLRRLDIGYSQAILDSKMLMLEDDNFHQWGQAVEIHDYGTAGHTERVAEMFVILAEALGVKGKDLQNGRKGAMLHDIGKLAIPDEILNKPGPLDEKEWEIMRQHPTNAFEMMMNFESLAPAMVIPMCHHEHWDGQGYPHKLSGIEIPLVARIFSVVDAFDALISKRPYKKGLTFDEALEIIKQGSGTQFDPEIVEYFVNHFDEINQIMITRVLEKKHF